jgi:hypothetical protein
MNVDGYHSRGLRKKRGIDCVNDDMRIKFVSKGMTSDRREWKKETCCADATYWDKGTMVMILQFYLA